MANPEQMMESMARSIPERTGKSVEEWIALIQASGLTEARDRRAWLKKRHGLRQNTQWALVWFTERAEGRVEPSGDQLVAAQYSGAKADLLPIYERLTIYASGLGSDVELTPRKTYVGFARRHQFGLVQASTRSRVDLGLRLPGTAATGRLQEAGSFGSGSTSHRVALSSVEEVDQQIEAWIRQAYQARG